MQVCNQLMKNLADKTKDYEAATAGLGLQTHFKKSRRIKKSANKNSASELTWSHCVLATIAK